MISIGDRFCLWGRTKASNLLHLAYSLFGAVPTTLDVVRKVAIDGLGIVPVRFCSYQVVATEKAARVIAYGRTTSKAKEGCYCIALVNVERRGESSEEFAKRAYHAIEAVEDGIRMLVICGYNGRLRYAQNSSELLDCVFRAFQGRIRQYVRSEVRKDGQLVAITEYGRPMARAIKSAVISVLASES